MHVSSECSITWSGSISKPHTASYTIWYKQLWLCHHRVICWPECRMSDVMRRQVYTHTREYSEVIKIYIVNKAFPVDHHFMLNIYEPCIIESAKLGFYLQNPPWSNLELTVIWNCSMDVKVDIKWFQMWLRKCFLLLHKPILNEHSYKVNSGQLNMA